jgi:hypothetical protein
LPPLPESPATPELPPVSIVAPPFAPPVPPLLAPAEPLPDEQENPPATEIAAATRNASTQRCFMFLRTKIVRLRIPGQGKLDHASLDLETAPMQVM